MRFLLVAVGRRPAAWVAAGFADYAQRLPRGARLERVAIEPAARATGAARALETEAARIRSALPRGCVRVVLDERGALLSSIEFARRLARWREQGRAVAFIIGGAEGLAPSVKESADLTWSLSPLTLPHGLAQVLVAEQLYRAISILEGHPYHRG